MKIKKIVDICRREGFIKIFTDESGVQWLGCAEALYPIYDAPKFNADEFFTVFDFTEKQKAETVFNSCPLSDDLCTDDMCINEWLCEELSPNIPFGSRLLIPLRSDYGIGFIDSKFLDPFSDEKHSLEIFERISGKGDRYYAVKVGMCLRAIITPFNAINKPFVDNIEEIYRLCKDTLDKREDKDVQLQDNM